MKNSTIFLGRGSLLGDIATYLPVLTLVEKFFPNSSKTFFINKKCAQILPLLANYPLIDRIYIGQFDEGIGLNDIDFIKKHNHYLEVNPQHRRWDWYNDEQASPNMVMENFNMVGMNWKLLNDNELVPKLVKWFDIDKKETKSIALWGWAGYFRDKNRSPTLEFWNKLVNALYHNDYKIYQFGHPNEPKIDFAMRCNELAFFDQIKHSLGCSLSLNTDSGSGLILGCYEGYRQITLLTNWMQNHNCNFNVLTSKNPNNISLFAKDGCDNIPQEKVLDYVKLLLS
ncbi:MAG: hypothetical protein AABY22_16270 [Nanoarchaeota archaeon]